MYAVLLVLATGIPPLPSIPPLPEPPTIVVDVSPKKPITEVKVVAEVKPERRLLYYQKECVDGVCKLIPVYAEQAPLPTQAEIDKHTRCGTYPCKPPTNTHNGVVCDYCGGTCWMVRVAEAAAAKKGDDSDQAVKAEFNQRYTQPTYRRILRRR